MERLKGKDLVNVGIYSAIYFVIVFIVAMMGVIPIFYPLLTVLVPLVGGIPFMMFLTKVEKFGMIWIMSIIMGIMMLLTGMGYYALVVGLITGLIAELIYRSGSYKSSAKAVLTYSVFSIWIWGNYLLFYLDRDGYNAMRQDLGQEHLDKLARLMPNWLCPVLLVACIICGLLGGLLGKKLLRKHFVKAGIA